MSLDYSVEGIMKGFLMVLLINNDEKKIVFCKKIYILDLKVEWKILFFLG